MLYFAYSFSGTLVTFFLNLKSKENIVYSLVLEKDLDET